MGQYIRSVTKNYEFYINFIRACSALIIYLSGIGRYRLVIVIIVYNLLNSIIIKANNRLYVNYILLPAMIIAILFDWEMGPLYPVLKFNSVLFTFILIVFVDKLVKTRVEKYISGISNGILFIECPSCGYGNMDLSSKCSNCNYESSLEGNNISNANATNQNDKLSKMLNLPDDIILYKLRLFPFVSVLINGAKEIRTYFVVTSKDIILIDYFYFSSSWRRKDIIPISSILSLRLIEKKMYVACEPTIEICTDTNNKYEIVFLKIFKSESAINNVIDNINKNCTVNKRV